ncbi:MAG: hypothetical protein WDL87_07705 [Candidatus Omnitrophota bacterium]|jgi:hypothetical protein
MKASDLKDWIEIIQRIKKIWSSPAGLLLLNIVILSAYYGPLKCLIGDFTDLIIPKYSLLFIKTAPFVIVILLIITWLLNRRLPKFSNKELGILFCPLLEEKTSDVVDRLKRSLHREIKEFGLGLKLKTLPANYEINDTPRSYQIREKTNAYLVIWGNFCKGNINEHKSIGFPRLSFTFKQPPILVNLVPHFGVDIGLGMFGKHWFVQENNDFWDIESLSNNITEASLNILGKILLLAEDFDRAIVILTHLLNSYLLPKIDSNKPFLKEFIFSVKRALGYSYRGKSLKIYRENIFNKIGDKELPSEAIKKCMALIKSAITLDSKNADHYLSSGILNFLLGNMKDAIDDIAKARTYNFREDGVSHLSGGFLYFFNGNMKKGLEQYRRAFKKEIPPVSLVEVLVFINKILDKYPEKIQLHLALGIINKERYDQKIAKQELRLFIEKAKAANVFNEYIPIVEVMLRELSPN